MTNELNRPECMIDARKRLRTLSTRTSHHPPLVYQLATALADRLPHKGSPHTFATQAIMASHQVYGSFAEQARSVLLAMHVPLLAQEVCSPAFAAAVRSIYQESH